MSPIQILTRSPWRWYPYLVLPRPPQQRHFLYDCQHPPVSSRPDPNSTKLTSITTLPVLRALTNRNTPHRLTATEIYTSFEQYLHTFNPSAMSPSRVGAGAAWLKDLNATIYANVYHSDHHLTVFTALHFLCLLARQLLPRPEPVNDDEIKERSLALDFILDQSAETLARKLPRKADQSILCKVVAPSLSAMKWFAPRKWRWERCEMIAGTGLKLAGHKRVVLEDWGSVEEAENSVGDDGGAVVSGGSGWKVCSRSFASDWGRG